MTLKTLSRNLCISALSITLLVLIEPALLAQNAKPSKVLRQLLDRQSELSEKFEREVSNGKAQPYEWDARSEEIRKLASTRAAEFKIADWKGSELLDLANLYRVAKQYNQVVEVYRAYFNNEADDEPAILLNAKANYARALLEINQVDEANKTLNELSSIPSELPVRISHIDLYKDVVDALRDAGRLEDAANRARQGFNLAVFVNRREDLQSPALAMVLRNEFYLAAQYIILKESLGLKKQADDFAQLAVKRSIRGQPEFQSLFDAELASARLIGTAAPEIVAAQWIDGPAQKISDLRGKVVLLDFWAMWCTPCLAAFPHLREFQTKYADKGFEIIGVTKLYGRSDKEENLSREREVKSLQEYKNRHQLSYRFAIGKIDDITNEEQYGVDSLPAIILIDRQGKIRQIKRGIGEYEKLDRQIARLIAEKQ